MVALAVGVVACGGDDDDSTTPTTATGSSAFCQRMRRADTPFDDAGSSDVPSREVLLREASSVAALATAAPAGIRGDLRTFAGAVRQIAELRGQVDLSDAALHDPKNAARLKEMSSALERLAGQVKAAGARVAKYLHDECGIETPTPTSTTTATSAVTSTTLG